MKKSVCLSLLIIVILIVCVNTRSDRSTIFEPGWTHFDDLAMMRDIDFDDTIWVGLKRAGAARPIDPDFVSFVISPI